MALDIQDLKIERDRLDKALIEARIEIVDLKARVVAGEGKTGKQVLEEEMKRDKNVYDSTDFQRFHNCDCIASIPSNTVPLHLHQTDCSQSEKSECIEEWSLKIVRVENGYILERGGGTKFVIEENENDELLQHEQLLFEVREYFGFQGSKHDKERIQILRQVPD